MQSESTCKVSNKNFKYDKCNRNEFDSADDFQSHFNLKHNEAPKSMPWTKALGVTYKVNLESDDKKSYQCQKCDKKFGTLSKIFYHNHQFHKGNNISVKRKNKNNPCKCENCGKTCLDKWKLNIHMISHEYETISTDNAEDIFQCKKCSKTFQSKFDFKQHFLKLHLDKNMKVYKCNFCEIVCTDNWKLRVHQNSHESMKIMQSEIKSDVGNKNLKCDTCSKMFSSKSYLKKHIITCQEINRIKKNQDIQSSKQYQCKLCKNEFNSSEDFLSHFHLYHNDTNFELCSEDAKKSENKKKTSHKCENCGKVCSDNWKLNIHRISHEYKTVSTENQGKILQCKNCKQTFESIFDFKQHFLKLHLDKNMKFYKCNSCERICTDNWKLKKHLESHKKGREISDISSVPLKRESIDIDGDAIEFKPENRVSEIKLEIKSEYVSGNH